MMLKVIGSLKGISKTVNLPKSVSNIAKNQPLTQAPLSQLLITSLPQHKDLPPLYKKFPLIDPIPLKQNIEKFDPIPCHPLTLPTPQVTTIEDAGVEKPSLHLMPLLVTIRRKKMKKHKRKKLRRKLLFVKRKFRHAQAKIKEKKIVDYETKQKKWGENYDSVAHMTSTLDQARKAGWGIDIIAEYKASKR